MVVGRVREGRVWSWVWLGREGEDIESASGRPGDMQTLTLLLTTHTHTHLAYPAEPLKALISPPSPPPPTPAGC